MAENSSKSSFADDEDRLQLERYSRSACLAALRGKEVPNALGLEAHRLCTIRGIRYHPGFGEELRGVLPVFTRALNARSIMSNLVPNLESPEDVPYCIWHPATASEETYRALACRYPNMKYQVGRACAVAGYTQLYQDLEILPDVHIAEEARECGSLAIYNAIMSQAVRYSIMNDYTLSIDVNNRQPSYMNADTAVKWMLDVKQELKDVTRGRVISDSWDIFGEDGYDDTMFNITEDMHIDEFESDLYVRRLATRPDLRLLYEPLPADLPTMEKDILIAMSAYLGDVDRYVRLRRPKRVYNEMTCCIRGIYHNTFFAVWCSKQPDLKNHPGIERAINARFIMNNVLAGAPYREYGIPYLIWWPRVALSSTYRHLAKLQPEMLPQIIRACIYAGYEDVFDELLPQVTPDLILINEAANQGNLHFRQALDERVSSLGIEPQNPPHPEGWDRFLSPIIERSSNVVCKYLSINNIGTSFWEPYDGRQCDAMGIEFMACLPDSWKMTADDPFNTRDLDYEGWPGGATPAIGSLRS